MEQYVFSDKLAEVVMMINYAQQMTMVLLPIDFLGFVTFAFSKMCSHC